MAVDNRRSVTDVLGVPISGLSMDALLDLAFTRIGMGLKTLFTTANAHSMVVAQRLPRFASHFAEAHAVLPDGISAVMGVRACGGKVSGRVSGPDFFEGFLSRAADREVSVFLMGTDDATLGRLAGVCRSRWPAIRIAGTLAPPFGELSKEQRRVMVDAVNAARPDALFVAMTAPRQELWLSEHFRDLDVTFAMGVGAAFDFLAGTKRRAPPVLGRLGIEWLYRLAREPRRLWRRNIDSLVYMAMVAGYAFQQAGQPPVEARRALREPARYSLTLGDVQAHTLDVSDGGLCVELTRQVTLGHHLEGVLHVDGAALPFRGDVAWAAPSGERSWRVGLRFVGPPPDLARARRAPFSAVPVPSAAT